MESELLLSEVRFVQRRFVLLSSIFFLIKASNIPCSRSRGTTGGASYAIGQLKAAELASSTFPQK